MNISKLSSSNVVWVISLVILIGFIGIYQIPPLVDFQAHVSLGMVGGPLFQFYQYQPALTYRLLDTIVRTWTAILGANYNHVMLATYLSVVALFLSTVYSFCLLLKMSANRALFILGILAGPIFLLLHTQHFIWGTIPFALSVFMAATSSAALWCLDDALASNKSIDIKTAVIFLSYTLLAIYSHESGFLYLAVGWIVPAYRLILIKDNWRKRFALFAIASGIIIAVSSLAFYAASGGSISSSVSSITEFSTFEFANRFKWLIHGDPYDAKNLLNTHDIGIFRSRIIHQLLTIMPFIVTYFLIRLPSFIKKQHNLSLLLIGELILALLIALCAPNDWWKLGQLPARHWLFICAWMFMAMAYLINMTPKKTFDALCLLSPVLVLLSCGVLNHLYASFRQVPIEAVANHYSDQLLATVKEYRKQHPETANKTVIIDYDISNIGRADWNHYHLVPFIMMLSPELIQNNIIIKEHWGYEKHLAIVWKEQNLANSVQLHWDPNQEPINLTPRS